MHTFASLMINDDIEEIIHRGESRTVELNSKYEGLTFEDLSNFKSEASVQQWEGEDFRTGVCELIWDQCRAIHCAHLTVACSHENLCSLIRWLCPNVRGNSTILWIVTSKRPCASGPQRRRRHPRYHARLSRFSCKQRSFIW